MSLLTARMTHSIGGLGVLPPVRNQGRQPRVRCLAGPTPAQFTRIARPWLDATTQPLRRRGQVNPAPTRMFLQRGSAHISRLKFAQTLLPPGPRRCLQPGPDPPSSPSRGSVPTVVYTPEPTARHPGWCSQTRPQPSSSANTSAFRILGPPVRSSCRLSHPPLLLEARPHSAVLGRSLPS